MKILAIYDRGTGVDATVVLEATATEAKLLTAAAALAVDLQFDLPGILTNAAQLQTLAKKLRNAIDAISP